MATFEQRLSTFVNWPHRGKHAPEYMAAAGWLHDRQIYGHSDAARCFNCDLTLVGWETADPVREHLKRNSHCSWITGKMMNTQEKREETFDNWPFEDQVSYMMVAAAGFFQSDTDTHTVTCYACQLTLGPQQLDTDPLRAHVRFNNSISPCAYLTKATTPAERVLPLSPPPTPPRLKHRCVVCHNRFPTRDALQLHLVDPGKAHDRRLRPRARKAMVKSRKVIGGRAAAPRRTALPGRRKVINRRRVPDLASRITRAPDLASRITRVPDLASRITRAPEYIKIEDDPKPEGYW